MIIKIIKSLLILMFIFTPFRIDALSKDSIYNNSITRGAVITVDKKFYVYDKSYIRVYGTYERVNGYASNIDLSCEYVGNIKPASCSFYEQGQNVRVFMTFDISPYSKEVLV